MEKNKMIQTTLVGLEGTLKNKIHALDITISNLVKYRPDEAGESVDPASMRWVLQHLNLQKKKLENKIAETRYSIQLNNICSTIQTRLF